MRKTAAALHHKGVTIARFEDIDSWKLARELTRLVYGVTSVNQFRRDFCLRDQIQRASVSIMSNIAEGYGRHGKVEFARFLTIARASAVEVRSQLYIALDLGYVKQEQFDSMFKLAERIEKTICGLITYLRER